MHALTAITAQLQTFDTAAAFAQQLGKTVIRSEDRPGFIINRVLMPMINEAFYALMEVSAACACCDVAAPAQHQLAFSCKAQHLSLGKLCTSYIAIAFAQEQSALVSVMKVYGSQLGINIHWD